MNKHYVDSEGNLLGTWDGGQPPEAIEVPTLPESARQKWDFVNSVWLPLVLSPEEASQAALVELEALDMKSMRDIREWVAAQPDASAELKKHEAQAVIARGKVL